MSNIESQFCPPPPTDIDGPPYSCAIFGIDFMTWNILALVIIAIEMSIYLTYYKDVVFCFVTLTNYIGMVVYIKYPDKLTIP